jgi:tRNA threonylcarbamoyladenosine biosynthesis protein TsaE
VTHSCNHSQPESGPHSAPQFALGLPDEPATRRAGARLAKGVAPGLRLYLKGELGSGKTTLVRGLLHGLGWRGRVKSPTYALVEVYVISSLQLYHFDFYRFLDKREWNDSGFRDSFDGVAVCIVEWPEKAGDALPPPDLELELEHHGAGRALRARAYSEAGERCLRGLRGD